MKAAEVIEQYKNGRRDFRGESLRGCNFKKQDLSGADFSSCDLRGANFSGANLTDAKFEKAKAGLQKRSVIFLLLLALALMVFSSVFSTICSHYIGFMFDKSSTQNQIVSWVSLIFLLFFCILTWRKNILAGAVAGTMATIPSLVARATTFSMARPETILCKVV
jgi:cation transport ATPase